MKILSFGEYCILGDEGGGLYCLGYMFPSMYVPLPSCLGTDYPARLNGQKCATSLDKIEMSERNVFTNVKKKDISQGASVPVCPGMAFGPHTR